MIKALEGIKVGDEILVKSGYPGSKDKPKEALTVTRVARKYAYTTAPWGERGFDIVTGVEKGDGRGYSSVGYTAKTWSIMDAIKSVSRSLLVRHNVKVPDFTFYNASVTPEVYLNFLNSILGSAEMLGLDAEFDRNPNGHP